MAMTLGMGLRVRIWWAVLAFIAMPAPSPARGPLDFRGLPATEALITLSPDRPDRVLTDCAMANRLLGTVAVVNVADLRLLAAASKRAEQTGWPEETPVLGYVHVSRMRDSATYRLGLTPDGLLLFQHTDDTQTYAIDAAACQVLIEPLMGYPGAIEEQPDLPTGEVVMLPQPYRRSPILLDTATIRERLNGGRKSELPETQRYLPDAQFFVRLPEGYSPRRPAGLIVWIDASPSGRPPAVFNDAADALYCIMIGAADAGNARLSTDRYQLGLDMVSTMTQRYHVDPERVYVTGISGGGRISSGLIACFPEVFTGGAVPIVGLNAYQHVPLGDGRFVVRGYGKPRGETWRLLKQRRIAPVTGPLDFNYREMVNATRIMTGDGLNVRMFDYEDMAHTLPTPERFLEALSWVDAERAEASENAVAEAEKLLTGYTARFSDAEIENEGQQRLLEMVIRTAPWSSPAWRACELLGIAPPAGDTPAIRADPETP